MNSRNTLIALLLVFTLVVLAGCAPADRRGDQPPGPAAEKVLKIALGGEPDNLDPHLLVQTESMRVMEQMYNSLLTLSPTLEIQADLAKEWSANEDGTVFTFKLREDVYFHNGRQMTAEDVRYSIMRVVDPEVGSPWEYMFGDLDDVRVVDQFTVEVLLKSPGAHVVAALATPFTAIIPKEEVDGDGLRARGVGTGPFKFDTWESGQFITLKKNERYHGAGLPKVDEIRWYFVEDPATRVEQVRSRTVHVDIDVPVQSLSVYDGMSDITVIGGEVVSYFLLGINHRRTPLNDVRVRQAISWAIDRDEIIQTVGRGYGSPLTGGPLPSNHWAYTGVSVYTHADADRAKALLRDAGHPNLTFQLLTRPGEETLAQVVQQQLARAGIQTTIERLEAGAFNRRVWQEHDFDVTVSRWGTMIDPDEFFIHFQTGGGWNPYGFGNAQIDALIDQGRRIMDEGQRRAIYGELEQIVAQELPYVFLYRPQRFAAFHKSVVGLAHEAANTRLSLQETDLLE